MRKKDNLIKKFHNLLTMASSSNQFNENSLITKSISSSKFNIVIREVTYLDGFTPDYNHIKLKHIAAFYGNAFGEKLGFMTYCPKTGVVYVHKTVYPCHELVTYLLIDDIKRAISPVKLSISQDIPNYEKIVSLFQEPVGNFIGTEMVGELFHRLHSMYSKSITVDQVLQTIKEFPLTLEFKIQYRPSLVGIGKELPHGIYFYPSLSFAQGTPYFVPYSKADGKTVHRMTFYTRKPHVPPFAMLNIDAQALFMNQNEVFCQNQAGYTNLRMIDILSRLGKRIDAYLFVPNSPLKTPKGRIFLTFSSLTINEQTPKTASDSGIAIESVRNNLSQTEKRVAKYIALNRSFYDQYPATSPSIKNITVFCYDGRKGKIPGCMFDSFKLPQSRESYYLTALKYAIQRRTLKSDIDLETWTEGREASWCAAVVMDMLCIYVNWCNYITDIVDHNEQGKAYKASLKKLIESFDVIRCRDSGDCEDFTREILMAAMELIFNVTAFKSTAIQKVRDIMDRFIFVSVLCGVSKASISFSEKNESSVRLAGHECALAIPKYIFFKALSRSGDKQPLIALYSEEERNKGRDDQIYVLEGTGNLFPEPREQTEEYQRLSSCFLEEFPPEITDCIRKQFFYHPKRDDNFYKRFISFLTPEFFLKFGYRGFEFLLCIEDKTKPGRFLRGVNFSNFLEIDNNPSIRLIEAPHIPVKTFRDASRLDDDNFPPTVIEPVALSEEMKNTAGQLSLLQPSVVVPQDNTNVFSFQLPKSTKIDSSFIELMRQYVVARKLNMLCFPEAVKLNHSTNDIVGGYTIHLFK